MGFSRVLDISNISTVAISNIVVHSLGSAIRKSNRVGSSGGISITILLGIEVGSAVVISYSILVSILGRFIISWGSMDGMGNRGNIGWGMVDNRSSMNNRGSMVNNRGTVDNWGNISRGMVDNRSSMVNRGSSMIGRGRKSSRGMDSSYWLLITIAISMNTLGSSMRLAAHSCMDSSMGFVDSMAD